MPEEEVRKFKLVSVGEHKFQVVDIIYENEEEVQVKCEVVSETDKGISLLYRISNNETSDFFWLTNYFLNKCLNKGNLLPSPSRLTR